MENLVICPFSVKKYNYRFSISFSTNTLIRSLTFLIEQDALISSNTIKNGIRSSLLLKIHNIEKNWVNLNKYLAILLERLNYNNF